MGIRQEIENMMYEEQIRFEQVIEEVSTDYSSALEDYEDEEAEQAERLGAFKVYKAE